MIDTVTVWGLRFEGFNNLNFSTGDLHLSIVFFSANEEIIHELDQVGWELHYEAALQMRVIPQDALSLNKGLIWTQLNLHWCVREDVYSHNALPIQNDAPVD